MDGPAGVSRRTTALGLAVSVLALGAVVWWASSQPAPKIDGDPEDIAAIVGAVALYALATALRSERWRILLHDQGAHASRADAYGLTIVGFAANTVLPARGGDVLRVLMMAPRAATTRLAVISTLLAERVLDVAVLGIVLVVLGLTVAGGEGLPDDDVVVPVAIGLGVLAVLGAGVLTYAFRHGRGRRIKRLLGTLMSATVNLHGRHGAAMVGMSVLIWAIEGTMWTAIAGAADLGLGALDGPYMLAVVGMFLLIPSGPGYAGTVDAATIIAVKAVGGSSAGAVAFLILMRFVVFVPITITGLVIGVTRYGGFRRLRRDPEAAAS